MNSSPLSIENASLVVTGRVVCSFNIHAYGAGHKYDANSNSTTKLFCISANNFER